MILKGSWQILEYGHLFQYPLDYTLTSIYAYGNLIYR